MWVIIELLQVLAGLFGSALVLSCCRLLLRHLGKYKAVAGCRCPIWVIIELLQVVAAKSESVFTIELQQVGAAQCGSVLSCRRLLLAYLGQY